jgi:hypothetical protein
VRGQANALKTARQSGSAELERELSRRATEFDPVSLVQLLHNDLGYGSEDVFFQSNHAYTSATALVQSVEFESDPVRHVVVTLNLGLLGTQSPLPSYFKQLLSGRDLDEGGLLEFIRFFDHRVIQGFINAADPARDGTTFKDFDQTKRSYLALLGLRSTSSLHWLFELIFPELGVRVEPSTLTRTMPLEGVRLNATTLGSPAVLGGQARIPAPGFEVTLYCDEERTDFGGPWVESVRQRLDDVAFPALAASAIDLRVTLVIRSETVHARLSYESYLGFDRIRGGQRRNRQVQVWSGEVIPGARCLRRAELRGASQVGLRRADSPARKRRVR